MTKYTPETPTSAGSSEAKACNPNPFMIALGGIERLLKFAKPVAITLMIASLLMATFLNYMLSGSDSASGSLGVLHGVLATPASALDTLVGTFPASGLAISIVIILTLGLLAAIALFFIFIHGMIDLAAASSARDDKITLKQTFSGVAERFWPYIKLRVLVGIKTLLWTLLFIIPGVYFTYRYKLAGVVFFTEDKTGNTAIKESLNLTKGAWLTTFASYGLFNLATLGAVQLLVDAGTTSELYRNYRQVADDEKLHHPRSHWLSWVFIVGLVGVIVLLTLLVIAVLAIMGGESPMNPPSGSPVWVT